MSSVVNRMRRIRFAFTLVELLVVIAIIGILVGMMLPAVQGMREASRRAMCSQNLGRISLGLSEYSLAFGTYPAGSVNPTGPIQSIPDGFHHNWISGVLPYIDYNVVFNAIDQDASIYAETNAAAMSQAVPLFRCPSATAVPIEASCYAGIHHSSESPIAEDNFGAFVLNKQLSAEDFVDGLGTTLFASEKLEDWTVGLAWLSGTRASLRNTGHGVNARPMTAPLDATGQVDPLFVGGLQSAHGTGVNALMGDGSVRYLANTIDMIFVSQLANRLDGVLAKAGASQ